jgi:glycosyltransferase involved in cell wall biosynthesis
MIEGRRIICFGDEEWEFTGTLQRMARTLATKNEFIYVTSLGVRLPRLTRSDLAKMARRARAWTHSRERVVGAARIITPVALPLYHSVRLTRVSAWLVYIQLCRLGVFPPARDTLLWIALPTAAPILDFLGRPAYFYHATDRQSVYPGANRKVMGYFDDQLSRNARFCVAASETLLAELRKHNPHSYCIDHGVDFAHFQWASAETPHVLQDLPRPIVGYLGGITEWVDQEALLALAANRPQWSIVLVGKDYVDIRRLLKFPNVRWCGPRPYPEVPQYIGAFDVCLLPRKVNEWEIYANPLKLLEYFCSGKPVVCSALPNVTVYGPLVHVYRKASEIVDRVEDALRESPELREQRREVARSKAHPHEVEELSGYIERHMLDGSSPQSVLNPDPSLLAPH